MAPHSRSCARYGPRLIDIHEELVRRARTLYFDVSRETSGLDGEFNRCPLMFSLSHSAAMDGVPRDSAARSPPDHQQNVSREIGDTWCDHDAIVLFRRAP